GIAVSWNRSEKSFNRERACDPRWATFDVSASINRRRELRREDRFEDAAAAFDRERIPIDLRNRVSAKVCICDAAGAGGVLLRKTRGERRRLSAPQNFDER